MCGLVGMYGLIGDREKAAMHWLLHFDVVRGEHSTGVLAVHKEEEEYTTNVYKELGRPEELYDTYPEVFKGDVYQPKNPLCLMGHNRHATQGTITKDTAHPFEYENLIGAHNGTVQPWFLKSLKGWLEWDIDSQIMFQHINDTGSVQDVWDTADGAIAFTWWNKQENALKIVRNNQRPLHWCVSKDGKTLFWASLPWMLSAALGKCGVQHEKIESFATDNVFTFSQDAIGKVTAKGDPLNPFVRSYGPVGYAYPAQNIARNNVEKSWFRLKEYVKEGPEDHQGYFIGAIEGNDDDEIVIHIDSNQKLTQKYRYEKVMEHWEDRNKLNLGAYYSFYEDALNVKMGFNTIDFWDITKLYVASGASPSALTKSKKQIGTNLIEIDGGVITKTEFDKNYVNGCCLCGTCVTFEEAKNTALFIKAELICKECKEEDMVKEWLAIEHSTNQGKVA